MPAENLSLRNGVLANGELDTSSKPNPNSSTVKKSRESERRRRRRKQKKKQKASQATEASAGDDSDAADDDSKENDDPQQVMEKVEVEYVPEKVELTDGMDEEFRKILEKFIFQEASAAEENDNESEAAKNAASNNKADSDSEDEEMDNQKKDKGVSNKKKKLQRRMKIAELKQICSRPDIVEVWDATASDPKLLVFLKSYRNSVPVPEALVSEKKFFAGGRL